MIDRDGAATRFGGAIALCWAVVSIAASALYSPLALAVGGLGGLLFLFGLLTGSRRRLGGGAFGIFAAALFAGNLGAPTDATLLGVIGAVLAWDAGGFSMGLSAQLGRDAPTGRVELVHVTASAVVGAITIALAYAAFSLGTGAGSISALLYLLLAAFVLLFAARIGSN